MSGSHNHPSSSLKVLETKGQGQFATAYSCQVVGENPAIDFAHNGQVLVKVPHDPNAPDIVHEAAVMEHLAKSASDDPAWPRSVTITDEGKQKTVSELIACHTDPETGELTCMDLEKFLRGQMDYIDPSEPTIYGVNVTVAMQTLFCSIQNTQDQLHSAGVLHFDSSCRNFMVCEDLRVKIIDFGLSEILPNVPDADFGVYPIRSKQCPVLCMDQEGLQGRQNISTDLLACRMTMMESLSLMLGTTLIETYNLKFSDLTKQEQTILDNAYANNLLHKAKTPKAELNFSEIGYIRAYSETMNDNFILERCVNNLYDRASKRHDELGKQVCTVVDAYRNYLVNLPKHDQKQYTPSVIIGLRSADQKLFNASAAKLDSVIAPQVSSSANMAASTTMRTAIPAAGAYAVAPSAKASTSTNISNVYGSVPNPDATLSKIPPPPPPRTTTKTVNPYGSVPNPAASTKKIPPPPPKTTTKPVNPYGSVPDPSANSRSKSSSANVLGALRNQGNTANTNVVSPESKSEQAHLAIIGEVIKLKCADKTNLPVVREIQAVLAGNAGHKLKTIKELAQRELNDHQSSKSSKDPRNDITFRKIMSDIASGDPKILTQQLRTPKPAAEAPNANQPPQVEHSIKPKG